MALPVACGEADTVLQVVVEGTPREPVTRFQVTVTVGDEERSLTIPEDERLITLPTSFTIQVPTTFQGRTRILVEAFASDGAKIAEGLQIIENLELGEINRVTVFLSPLTGGNTPDGGVDDKDADPDDDAPVDDVDANLPQDAEPMPDADAPDVMDIDAPAPTPDASPPDLAPDAGVDGGEDAMTF